jgi:hypothetical protein
MGKFEFLESALQKKFSPRYYKEDLRPFHKKPVYIAMKCFCDIPLSNILNHTNVYGKYALGFSKEWALKNSINPVAYYNKESKFVGSIKESYNHNIKLINKLDQAKLDESFSNLAGIKIEFEKAFENFKPVKGRMWRNNKWNYGRNFYNEREWRYISNVNFGNSKYKSWYLEPDLENLNIDEMNNNLEINDVIQFKYSDINFIIVHTNEDVENLCSLLDDLEQNDISPSLLKTRIIKIGDIRSNF